MSRPVKPAYIGLFVLAGMFLAVATLIYVGSIRLFAKEETFLLYFGESVNGLNVGSPVKFKGVRIGSVSEIQLFYNQDPHVGGAFIPVFVKIDESRVRNDFKDSGRVNLFDWQQFQEQLDQGLRGRLQLESFITGQLFVELDYFAEPGEPYRTVQKVAIHKEIPTLPSIMADLGSSTSNVLATVASIDFRGISDQLSQLLIRLNQTVGALEPERWNASLTGIGENLDRLLSDVDIQPTIERLNLVLDDFHRISLRLDASIDPAVADYQQLIGQLSETLERGNRVMDNLDQMTAPDALLQRELHDTLVEFHRAARAAREFINYLERNPRALISGRGDS